MERSPPVSLATGLPATVHSSLASPRPRVSRTAHAASVALDPEGAYISMIPGAAGNELQGAALEAAAILGAVWKGPCLHARLGSRKRPALPIRRPTRPSARVPVMQAGGSRGRSGWSRGRRANACRRSCRPSKGVRCSRLAIARFSCSALRSAGAARNSRTSTSRIRAPDEQPRRRRAKRQIEDDRTAECEYVPRFDHEALGPLVRPNRWLSLAGITHGVIFRTLKVTNTSRRTRRDAMKTTRCADCLSKQRRGLPSRQRVGESFPL